MIFFKASQTTAGKGKHSIRPAILRIVLAAAAVFIWFGTSTSEGSEEDFVWEEEENPIRFNATFDLEFSSIVNTYADQETSDAVKKNEVKSRVTATCGSDTFYLYSATWLSFNLRALNKNQSDPPSCSDHREFSKSLRFSSSESEIALNEFYVNYTRHMVRFRMGNQVFNWGSMFLTSPTAYFNPGDWRDLFFNMIQEDPMIGIPSISWLGTPAISTMVFLDAVTLEMVVSPIHTPMLLPLNNSFWSVEMDNDLFRIHIDPSEEMDVSLENTGVGIRVSGNILNMDVSVSAFHGPDKEPVLMPYSILLQPNGPVTVVVRPEYRIIDMVGLEISYTRGNVGLQFEAAYSPEKHFLPNVDSTMLGPELEFPMTEVTSRYLQVAVGLQYFLPLYKVLKGHQGISAVYVEYAKSVCFDGPPVTRMFPDLLVCGVIDSFLDNRLETAFIGAVDPESRSYILQPRIGIGIWHNLKFQLSYTHITGKSKNDGRLIESVFYYYRDKDVVIGKIACTF